MSYYSSLVLHYTGNSEISIADLASNLKNHLDTRRIHHDVIEDISKLFSTGEATIKLYGYMIDDILLWVSAQKPDAPFGVQGRGEELRDVWVREYEKGEATFSRGPFDETA
jgi:hypothetical protein